MFRVNIIWGQQEQLHFCGENRYQLIASRRNSDLFKKEKHPERANLLGFTLVRRHILDKDEKSRYKKSWYEYFCLDGKKENIPTFNIESDGIEIGLCSNFLFKSGAIVKLFSYQFTDGASGTARGELYQRLNQLLYSPALPFLIEEKRENFKKFNPLVNTWK